MSMKTIKSDEARQNWRGLLDDIGAGDDVVIERYTKPVAAIISYADYLALQEELEDLRAARRAEEILERAKDDPEAFVPWEQVRADLIEDGLLTNE